MVAASVTKAIAAFPAPYISLTLSPTLPRQCDSATPDSPPPLLVMFSFNKKVSRRKSMPIGSDTGAKDPARVEALGSHLYLFKYSVDALATNLIISAHGRECPNPPHFDLLAGESLAFYSLHGYTSPARSLYFAAGARNEGEGEIDPSETVEGPGNCDNYLLAKFQGINSGNGETYDSVQALQTPDRHTHRRMVRVPENGVVPDNAHRFNVKRAYAKTIVEFYDVEGELPDIRGETTFDVITIRNRWFGREVTLATVMKEVRKLNHEYETIHCSFCRGEK